MVLTKCSSINARQRDFLEMLPGGWLGKNISAVKETNNRAGVSPLHFAPCPPPPRAKRQQFAPPVAPLLQTRSDTAERRVLQKSSFLYFFLLPRSIRFHPS